MKNLKKKFPGDPLSSKDYNDLIDAIYECRIKPSPTVTSNISAGGTVLSVQTNSKPISASDKSGGIILELHEVWDGDVIYRLNERVCFKPSGSTYYYVYKCLDITAGASDSPDAVGSTKWELITKGIENAEWSDATAYTVGAKVRFGTLFQHKVYTCAVTTTAGQSPSTNPDNWTEGDEVIYGLEKFPPVVDDKKYKVPFSVWLLTNSRYNQLTHMIYVYWSVTTYDINQKMMSMELITEVSVTEAIACSAQLS